jgi:hypothetical protein
MAEQHAQRKDKVIKSGNRGVIFGASWAWVAIVLPPFVMLVLPAEIISYFVHPAWPLDVFTITVTQESEAFARHLNHRIVYAAMIFFHVTLCLCLIVLFWDRLRDFAGSLRRRAYVLMLIEASLFLAILRFYWRSTDLYTLSYINIRELLAKTCVLDDVLAPCVPDCVVDGVTRCVPDLDSVPTKLSMFVYIPQIFSIAALTVALAVAASVIGNLEQLKAQDWQKRFDDGVKSLQFCFFGLSAVLVTSTIAATLFFQFPASLTAADNPAAAALSEYARTLTVYWGTVYTLTLIATFAPAALILRGLVRRYEQGAESSAEFKRWLTDKALVSPIRLITNFLAMLAPMLFGAAGSLMKFLPGAG